MFCRQKLLPYFRCNRLYSVKPPSARQVLHFVDGVHIIKDNLMETAPVFRLIQKNSGTPWEEMYKVFNMGHRYLTCTQCMHVLFGSVVSSLGDVVGCNAFVVGRSKSFEISCIQLQVRSVHQPGGSCKDQRHLQVFRH